MDAFRTRLRRHGGIDERPDSPLLDATFQFVVIATDKLDVVFRPARHLGYFMRGKAGRIDQCSRFDRTSRRPYDVMRGADVDAYHFTVVSNPRAAGFAVATKLIDNSCKL